MLAELGDHPGGHAVGGAFEPRGKATAHLVGDDASHLILTAQGSLGQHIHGAGQAVAHRTQARCVGAQVVSCSTAIKVANTAVAISARGYGDTG